MRRKVIQIADSTQLVSLPRKWCIKQNIKKGDELNVEIDGSKVIVACDLKPQIERFEMKMKDYGVLAPRFIHALYKRGMDEIKIYMDTPQEFNDLQKILSNETVGLEIIEQGKNYCVAKNVSGQIEGFDSVLRRTFLLTCNLAEDCAKAMQEKNFESFSNLLLLEKSNNKFTTLCRRYLNKYGSSFDKIGPVYFIIENIENIADEYKYLFHQLTAIKNDQLKISGNCVEIYQKIAKMISDFQEVFYKYDNSKLVNLADVRKKLIEQCYSDLKKSKSYSETILLHHALILIQKIFNLVGPYMVVAQGRLIQQ